MILTLRLRLASLPRRNLNNPKLRTRPLSSLLKDSNRFLPRHPTWRTKIMTRMTLRMTTTRPYLLPSLLQLPLSLPAPAPLRLDYPRPLSQAPRQDPVGTGLHLMRSELSMFSLNKRRGTRCSSSVTSKYSRDKLLKIRALSRSG